MSLCEVRATGSNRDLGSRYGEAAREEIHAAIEFYRSALPIDFEEAAHSVAEHMNAARVALPHLVQELEGLAEGSGATFEELVVLNCMEELSDLEACTTIVSGRFLMHAEQWYGGHDQIAVVIAEPDEGPAFVSPTCTGFLPAVGMNAHGIALGVDSLPANDDRVGVPRLLVSRSCIDARSIEGVIAAATIESRSGGYAYLVAARDRAVTIETTATTGEVRDEAQVHTNHPLCAGTASAARPATMGSLVRFLRASEIIATPPRSVHDCFALLSDHDGEPQSICNHVESPLGSSTVFGMVCDLWEGVVYVSDGPPCEGRWNSFDVPAMRTEVARDVG